MSRFFLRFATLCGLMGALTLGVAQSVGAQGSVKQRATGKDVDATSAAPAAPSIDQGSSVTRSTNEAATRAGKRAAKSKKPDEVFVSLVQQHWKTYYAKYYAKKFAQLTDAQLKQSGLKSFKAADPDADDDHTFVFALIMLNWRAQMLELSPAFIEDATAYWQSVAPGYGTRWYEYQLDEFENAIMGKFSPPRPPL